MARLNVWMDADLLDVADKLATLTSRSTSNLIEMALMRVINDTHPLVMKIGRQGRMK